jgi:FkbM family methyltransferase
MRSEKAYSGAASEGIVDGRGSVGASENIAAERANSAPTGVSAEDVVACIEMILGRTPDPALVEYHLGLGFPNRCALGDYMIRTGEFRTRYAAKTQSTSNPWGLPAREVTETSEFIEIDDGNCPAYNLALPIEKGDYTRWVAATRHNSDVAVFVLDYLGGRGTFVDVGANIGTISIPSAVAGSHVIAVELLPANCFYYNLSIMRNELNNVRLYQMAAGKERRLVCFGGTEAWGHIVQDGQGPCSIMLSLDEIVDLTLIQSSEFIKSPMLIKVDTEGYELEVLLGATRLISKFEPAFLIESITIEGRNEYSDKKTCEVKSFLEQNGYHLYLHRGNCLIPRSANDIQEGHVSDYFAVKRRYEEGEQIGRFVVTPLSYEDSVHWVKEMVEYPVIWHRMHAAGVLGRWIKEGRQSPQVLELAQRLLADQEQQVADFASQIIS